MSERLKHNHYHKNYCNSFFWRTKQQQEIDYLEENDGTLYGYEFKWNPHAKLKAPKSYIETYKASVAVINKENFSQFLGFA